MTGDTIWQKLQDALGVGQDDPLTITTKICPHDGAVLESDPNLGDPVIRCPVCYLGFIYYDDDDEEEDEDEGNVT